jgi:predicted NBD/HSP70 family sugar kinase
LESFNEVVELARGGNREAGEILAASASLIAEGARTLVMMMDVDLLTLSGRAFDYAGDFYVEKVRQRVN